MIIPTGTTVADYTAAIYAGNPTHVKIVFLTQNREFTDEHIAADGGVTLSTYSNTSEDVRVGNVVTSELTVHFIHDKSITAHNTLFNGLNWMQEVQLYFGVEISGTTNWVSLGYFTAKKPPRRNVLSNTIIYTAVDRTGLFNGIADGFLSSNSRTMISLTFMDLCTYLGLEGMYTGDAGQNPELFTNFGTISRKIPQGTTYRQLFSWLAEASGRFVRATNTGKIELASWADWTRVSAEVVENNYFDFELEGYTVPIKNSVLLSSTNEGTNYLYPVAGTNPYKIVDNPIMLNSTQANVNIMITAIVQNLTAYGAYVPASIEAVGNWLLEPGDGLTIYYDTDQTTYETINNRVLQWNGSCTARYEFSGSEDEDDFLTEEVKNQYKLGGIYSTKDDLATVDAKASQFDSSLSILEAFKGKSTNTAANNNKFQFTLPWGSHAIVCIASGFVSFFNGGNPPQIYNTTMPTGFTATLESDDETITLNRSTNTRYSVHGIVFESTEV